MADRYLLESGSPDGYLLEDSSGVLLLDAGPISATSAGGATTSALLKGTGAIVATANGVASGTTSRLSGSAFTFVQKAWNSTAGGTPANTTLSLPSVGAGHLVLVSVEYLGTATGFTMTVTDGNGHSFTITPNSPFQYSTLARYIWLGYILSAAAGTMTITATPSVAHGISIHAVEFAYTGTAVFDKDIGGFSTTGTTPINTPSITPTNINALLYAAGIADPAGAGTLTGVGSAWTEGTRGTIASDSNNSGDAYLLGTSIATAVSWTVASSSSTGWNAAVMAFNVTAPSSALAGSINGVAASTALLKGAGAALSTVHGAATTSALLKGSGVVASTVHGAATTSALLKGKAAAATAAHGASTTSALLKGAGAALATSHGVAASSALLTGSGVIATASHGTATASAALKGSGAVASVVHGVAATIAMLTSGAGPIVATAHGTAATTAQLQGSGSVLSTVHGASTTASVLSGRTALATSAHGVAGSTAVLRGSAALAAVSHGRATVLAAIHNAAPPILFVVADLLCIPAMAVIAASIGKAITAQNVRNISAITATGTKQVSALAIAGAEIINAITAASVSLEGQ